MAQKAKNRMNCPKCGHEQEERLDCKKCGVVFTKFYALYPQQGATALLADNTTEVMELSEISRLIRDLSRRFNEFEFERAERSRLRGDLRVLDQKVESGLKELADQIAALQGQDVSTFAPRTETGIEGENINQILAPLQSRLQHLEGRLEAALAEKSGGRESENLRTMEARLASMDGRISNLQAQAARVPVVDSRLDFDNITKELAGMQASIQSVTAQLASMDGRISSLQNQWAQSKVVDLDPDKMTQELAGMQTALQNVTVRYSEIGELKKKDLVLSNSVDAVLRDLALLKEDSSKGSSKKIAEFEKEVTALRAEVRQMLKDRQDLPPLEVDVHSIRENLEEIRRFMSSLSQKL